ALPERDEDVAALDLGLVARDLQVVRDALAGADVVLPGVPGAGDDAALEVALAERAAAMRALVVERVKDPVHVEERDVLAADRHSFSGAGSDLGHRADLHERRHGRASGTRHP